MYLLGKVDVSRRNLTMMNGIHHREYVIQSICVRRTVAYRVAFSRTGVEGDQAMNSSRSISSPYVQYTRIDPLLISISILSLSLSFSFQAYEINAMITLGRGKKIVLRTVKDIQSEYY